MTSIINQTSLCSNCCCQQCIPSHAVNDEQHTAFSNNNIISKEAFHSTSSAAESSDEIFDSVSSNIENLDFFNMDCTNEAFSFFNEFDGHSFESGIWAPTSDELSTLCEVSATASASALETSTPAALIIDTHTTRDSSQDKNQLYERVKYLERYVSRFFQSIYLSLSNIWN